MTAVSQTYCKKQQQHDIIIYCTASKMKVKSLDLRKLMFLTW